MKLFTLRCEAIETVEHSSHSWDSRLITQLLLSSDLQPLTLRSHLTAGHPNSTATQSEHIFFFSTTVFMYVYMYFWCFATAEFSLRNTAASAEN